MSILKPQHFPDDFNFSTLATPTLQGVVWDTPEAKAEYESYAYSGKLSQLYGYFDLPDNADEPFDFTGVRDLEAFQDDTRP